LKERYEDNSLTHLDLWLKTRSFGGPDRNWMYEFSNTTTKNLQMTCNVLTVKCSESVHSWVQGNVKPTSTWSDNSSQWKIWITHCGLWRTLLNSNWDKITHGWSMCSSLLDLQSRRRPTFSSSFSNVTSVLDLFLLLQHNLYFRFIVFESTNV